MDSKGDELGSGQEKAVVEKPKSRRWFQFHLSTAVITSLMFGLFVLLTIHSKWSSGSTHLGFPITEAFTDQYPWIDDWYAAAFNLVCFLMALKSAVLLFDHIIRRREGRRP